MARHRPWRRVWTGILPIAVALLVSNTAATAAAEPDTAASRSRLVFAAAEEVSTLHGFNTGQLADPDSYWAARRNLDVFTPEAWKVLRERRARISVNLRWQRDFGPVPPGKPRFDEMLPFLREAERNDVGVVAWLTIPYADGYWATEDNVGLHEQMIGDFDDWANDIGFTPEQVLLDLESSLQDTATNNKAFRDPLPVAELLSGNIDPAQQCEAMRGYEAVVARLEQRGYPTVAAVYPFLFDDLTNGDSALSDGLGMPLPRPGTFRGVSFMTMRSTYANLIGIDPGPSIHSAYIDDMRRWYGNSATFNLGEAGEGPYRGNLAAFVQDTRLAAALTTGAVGMYSLDKALANYGPDGVAALFDAVEKPLAGDELARVATISPGARAARALIGAESTAVSAAVSAVTAARGKPQLPNRWPSTC
ncbi:hypothetical protein [Aldersonia kunmingensis]|uniref:hypothetical protein n=1 Tax=Aldersonia kunmingensis TaxID=408066 RepID=UPI00082B16FA|nr:hypothetical protein [Aldersonia kunmingensis]